MNTQIFRIALCVRLCAVSLSSVMCFVQTEMTRDCPVFLNFFCIQIRKLSEANALCAALRARPQQSPRILILLLHKPFAWRTVTVVNLVRSHLIFDNLCGPVSDACRPIPFSLTLIQKQHRTASCAVAWTYACARVAKHRSVPETRRD